MKMHLMKMMTVCALALVAVSALAEQQAPMPREAWNAKVGDCAKDPGTMASIMSQLSAADQAELVKAVNEAIAKMPGSAEQKAANAIQANIAGIKVAMTQNKEKRSANAVIAESFATMPPEFLPQFIEALSGPNGPLNRGNVDMEKFTAISTNTLHAICERCEKAENNGGVREAFAAIMFLQASNDKDPSKDLINTMLSQIPDDKTRDLAAKEWVGPALDKNYDPILAAANAGDEPDRAIVASISAGKGSGGDGVTSVLGEPGLPSPVLITGTADVSIAMLAELSEGAGANTPTGRMGAGALEAPAILGVGPNDMASDIGLNRVPRAYVNNKDENNPYYKHGRNGSGTEFNGYSGQGLSVK